MPEIWLSAERDSGQSHVPTGRPWVAQEINIFLALSSRRRTLEFFQLTAARVQLRRPVACGNVKL